MQLSMQDFRDILDMGIRLSVETDSNKLLGMIVEQGIKITHCDASVLYLYEDHYLKFKIIRNLSQNLSEGMDGEEITSMPPVDYSEENVCAYTAMHRRVVNIPDLYSSREFDFSGPRRYDTLMDYKTHSMLVIPMENNKGELLGVLQMINALDSRGNIIPFHEQYEMIIRALGSIAAITLTNIAYVAEMKKQLHSFVEAMATAVDERTPYNGSHTRKVAEYSLLLARKINEKYRQGNSCEKFDEMRLEKLQLAAQLHDIGKMVIPKKVMNRSTRLDKDIQALKDRYKLLSCQYEIDLLKGRLTREQYEEKLVELQNILEFVHRIDGAATLPDQAYERVQEIAEKRYTAENGEVIPYLTEKEREYLSVRKGTLTPEDRKIMESHVSMTAKILSKVHFNKEYADVPRWAGEHHEFLDGSGYPNHLTGKDLDVETRILTVADIYDALTSWDRPYKKPMSKDRAFSILHEMAREGKLDERLVCFLEEAIMGAVSGSEPAGR